MDGVRDRSRRKKHGMKRVILLPPPCMSFYISLQDPSRKPEDHMESFFPGETLKYLYLLMQPDHPIDLMKYTFNTEAHPLKVFPLDGGGRGDQILS